MVHPLDRAFLHVPCQRCGYEVDVQFRLAQLEDVVFCACCKARIRFSDEEASGSRARRSIHNALAELERTIENLNRTLTINL